jgi:translation elongation factor P
MISSNDFKVGATIEIDNYPWRVMEHLHVKPGKGAAFVRTKLKNYITGNTVEKTFRGGEMVASAEILKSDAQFTYVDGGDYVFMDNASYEETRVPRDEAWAKYLKEGCDAFLVKWNGRVISVDLPAMVELEVAETDPGLKGNTAQGGSKPATLETGAVVQVPLFINPGERVKVDTRTDEYLSRA